MEVDAARHIASFSCANKLGGMLRRFGAVWNAKLGLDWSLGRPYGYGRWIVAARGFCHKEDCRGGEHAKQRQDPC